MRRHRYLLLILIFLAVLSASADSKLGPPPLQSSPNQPTDEPDPLLPNAWHLTRIRAPKAWAVTRGERKVSIAVVDSGIDYNHPDLNPNLRRNAREWPPNGIDDDENGFIDDVIGWDFVHNHPAPWDRTGHGTAVAGIAAAAGNNGIGSAGVCPKCSILPVRFLNYNGEGWDEDGLAAVRYSIMMRAPIINISFAGEGYDRDYHDALREALARDLVVVAAAGNDGENIDKESIYPPKFKGLPNMIVVAAVDKYDHLVRDPDSGRGSNWSKNYVHIAAPGEDVLAPWNDGTWDMLHGTSYAAPIVAGAAALVRSANPRLSAPEIVRILMATARTAAPLKEKIISGGVVDVAKAVACATTAGLPCL